MIIFENVSVIEYDVAEYLIGSLIFRRRLEEEKRAEEERKRKEEEERKRKEEEEAEGAGEDDEEGEGRLICECFVSFFSCNFCLVGLLLHAIFTHIVELHTILCYH